MEGRQKRDRSMAEQSQFDIWWQAGVKVANADDMMNTFNGEKNATISALWFSVNPSVVIYLSRETDGKKHVCMNDASHACVRVVDIRENPRHVKKKYAMKVMSDLASFCLKHGICLTYQSSAHSGAFERELQKWQPKPWVRNDATNEFVFCIKGECFAIPMKSSRPENAEEEEEGEGHYTRMEKKSKKKVKKRQVKTKEAHSPDAEEESEDDDDNENEDEDEGLSSRTPGSRGGGGSGVATATVACVVLSIAAVVLIFTLVFSLSGTNQVKGSIHLGSNSSNGVCSAVSQANPSGPCNGANSCCLSVNYGSTFECDCACGFNKTGGSSLAKDPNGPTCEDIDECAINASAACPTSTRPTCENQAGTYCCLCALGYNTTTFIIPANVSNLQPSSGCPCGLVTQCVTECIDIDECEVGSDICPELPGNLTCVNLQGSYKCINDLNQTIYQASG